MGSLKSGLQRYKESHPNGTAWTKYKVEQGELGEKWTQKRLARIMHHYNKFTFKNTISWGSADIDHLVEYENGRHIMLDSKNWKGNHEQYLNEKLSSKLQSEANYLKNQKGIKVDAIGVVLYNVYVPNGIEKTNFGFYKIHPDYLGKFIKDKYDE